MKSITTDHLDDIAVGATLLGSGGGGDPEYDLLITKELIEKNGAIPICKVDELENDALIVPLAFIGAPLVSLEKLPSGKECIACIREVERFFGKRVTALVAAEIGGSNAFCALQAASLLGLPVVDADTLGRAFPELHMSSANLHGISASPAFLSDCHANVATLQVGSAQDVERFCRALSGPMGASAACAVYIMSGKEATYALIKDTLSQAYSIGKKLRAKEKVLHPIATGVVTDIEQEINDGFLRGKITICSQNHTFSILYQNEYLIVFQDGKMVIATPDIIALLDEETHIPLSIEKIKYGRVVAIASYPAPALWKGQAGLQLVGPQAFGVHV